MISLASSSKGELKSTSIKSYSVSSLARQEYEVQIRKTILP